MDSKAMQQLLDKYWEGDTSLEEERQLKAFFQQEELPAEFRPFQGLFQYFKEGPSGELPADFSDQLIQQLSEEPSTPKETAKVRSLRTPVFLPHPDCCCGSLDFSTDVYGETLLVCF